MKNYYFLLKFYFEHLKQLVLSCLPTDESYKVPQLPGDVLVEILSRLPAEKVLECRRVCKYWNTLTYTPHFLRKNKSNTSPSILIAYYHTSHLGNEEQHVFLFNELGERTTSKNNIKRLGPKKSIYPVTIPNHLYNSAEYNHLGLIIFLPYQLLTFPYESRRRSRVLYNPVTRQKLVFNTYGFICAYFYHPFTDEYRLIWCEWKDDYSPIEYRILNLGSSSPVWRRLEDLEFVPVIYPQSPFVLNNKKIHWIASNNSVLLPRCNNCILIFDINKEEFSKMPHPGNECTMPRNRHDSMYLLELRCEVESSLLCLCDCSIQDQIEMWVLEDYDGWIWAKRRRIFLDVSIYRSQLACRIVVEPFGLVNGEMLIYMGNLGVFAYDISTGTLRRIIELVNGSIGFNADIHHIRHVGLFYKSLASFTNFKDLYFSMEPR